MGRGELQADDSRDDQTEAEPGEVAGSLKIAMPRANAPTAPIPVHTAYAVPIGMTFCATSRNAPLSAMHTTANAIQVQRSPLSASPNFSPTGQPHSKSPATIK